MALNAASALPVSDRSAFGGTAQVIFTWLIEATGNKLAPLWYVVAMSVVSILATAALTTVPGAPGARETKDGSR